MTTAANFRPDPALYDGLVYRPPEADALTDAQGPGVGAFLDAAKARGLETWRRSTSHGRAMRHDRRQVLYDALAADRGDYLRTLAARTDFAPGETARALGAILAFAPRGPRDPGGIRYPEPDEPHPAQSADIVAKMRAARAAIGPGPRIFGITHAYGPLGDVMRRSDAVAGAGGVVQVNRYGYMSDDELAAIGERRRRA